jgi:hypothetical protein
MSKINYICSLGTRCIASMLIKQNKMQTGSYPFDWIFSNPDMVSDCIEDNFQVFLDKKQHISLTSHKSNHEQYVRKRNITNNNTYESFIRCVTRFNTILNESGRKLFIVAYPMQSSSNISPDIIQSVTRLYNTLNMVTSNFKILVIYHVLESPKRANFHTNNDIDYLTIYHNKEILLRDVSIIIPNFIDLYQYEYDVMNDI